MAKAPTKKPRVLESKEAASKATNKDKVIKTGTARTRKVAKSSVTGKIVSQAEAKANPGTTFTQTVKTKPKEKVSLRREYPRAFDNGRRARLANIGKDQMPVLYGDEQKAWLEGYGKD